MGHNVNSQDRSDAETVYTTRKSSCNDTQVVGFQNTHTVGGSDSVSNTLVMVGNKVALNAMVDSGSMACTINGTAEIKFIEAGVVTTHDQFNTDVVLIGCGGRHVKPKSLWR